MHFPFSGHFGIVSRFCYFKDSCAYFLVQSYKNFSNFRPGVYDFREIKIFQECVGTGDVMSEFLDHYILCSFPKIGNV